MALIKCPECGRDISDKVKACPHCGFPLSESTEENAIVASQPVELTGVKLTKKFPTKILVIIASSIAVVVLGIFGVKTMNERKAQQAYEASFDNYVDRLHELRLVTIIGGAKAEDLCNLTGRVWSNAIFEEFDSETDKYTRPDNYWLEDFNEALRLLFVDDSIISTIKSIESNQNEVQEIMKQIQNPPEGLENCYETATELFTAYKGLTDLAINPSGSLQTFSETKEKRIRDFMDEYAKLESQIPEKFNEDAQ